MSSEGSEEPAGCQVGIHAPRRRLPRWSAPGPALLHPEHKNPVSNSATWLESHRREKYVTSLGLIMICVFLVFFDFMPLTDFCGSSNLETFISEEMGPNQAPTGCLVQVISQRSGLASCPHCTAVLTQAQRVRSPREGLGHLSESAQMQLRLALSGRHFCQCPSAKNGPLLG